MCDKAIAAGPTYQEGKEMAKRITRGHSKPQIKHPTLGRRRWGRRERCERLLAAVFGLLGAGRGARKKRLTGANELLGLLLVNGFAMELGGIEQ